MYSQFMMHGQKNIIILIANAQRGFFHGRCQTHARNKNISKTNNSRIYYTKSGPGSIVGIATAYGLDGPGIESRWEEIFRTSPDRP